MHRYHTLIAITFSGLAAILIAGCGANKAAPGGSGGTAEETHASDPGLPPDTVDTGHDNHGHDHPSEGPHHGRLIELGNEEYHAELVHDEDRGTVTIYILDGSAKQSVPIGVQQVVINLKHGGQGEQFKLAASPDTGDPAGQSSRFVSNDAELGEDLHIEDGEARLVVKIAGKSYTGKIEHDGDHGHDNTSNHDH